MTQAAVNSFRKSGPQPGGVARSDIPTASGAVTPAFAPAPRTDTKHWPRHVLPEMPDHAEPVKPALLCHPGAYPPLSTFNVYFADPATPAVIGLTMTASFSSGASPETVNAPDPSTLTGIWDTDAGPFPGIRMIWTR